MRQHIKKAGVALLALAALGCNASTDKNDAPVILTVVGTTTVIVPYQLSVSDTLNGTQAGDRIGSVTLTTFVKEPNATTTNLETVEMEAYEVTFTRADRGTRVPAPFHHSLFGSVTPGGQLTLTNYPWIGTSQLTSLPISDLTARGVDSETGSVTIKLDAHLKFFAHTVTGKRVDSETKTFTVEIFP